MISRFINKVFKDINEVNIFMSANPTLTVHSQGELANGDTAVKFKVQCK